MRYDVTDFERDVIDASHKRPVLVDFWAGWCSPCRVLGPTLEALADASGDRWDLVKVNVDKHPSIAQQYGVRGIPAVKLFADGAVAAAFTGALPKPAVQQWIDTALETVEGPPSR